MKYFLLNLNLSQGSVKNYLYWINVYCKFANNMLSHHLVLDFKDYCQKKYAVATQRLIFTSINYLLEFHKVKYRLEVPHLNFTFKRDIIDEPTYNKMLADMIFEDPFVSTRNRNMLIVLWQTGLRIGELINLKWSDVGNVYICITSKNNHTRFIPYYHKLFDELKLIKNSDYVFATRGGKRMSYATIYKMFKKLGNDNFSPHAMRHSFATRLLQRGVPINYVSNLLGHSSVDTTLIYLHYKNEDIVRELREKDWLKIN